jgi:hypothetical protein
LNVGKAGLSMRVPDAAGNHRDKEKENWVEMKSLIPLISVATLAAGSAVAFAQDADVEVGNAKPMFAVLPHTVEATARIGAAGTPLPTFNGSFTYQNQTFNYNMVGAAPSQNSTTTINTIVIPVKIVITSTLGTKTTFDPSQVLPNGKTVTANTTASPIFDRMTDYIQGGVDLGKTQYIDAFQRGNFWNNGANANYHLLLGGPTVDAEQTLSPPSSQGKTGRPFGNKVAEVNINWLDNQLHTLLTKLAIQPNTLPIFLLYDTYLTSGGCCIGGYHSSVTNFNGTVSYAEFTYIDYAGNFSQDVSALSHEVGEWADDPLVNNGGNLVSSKCGSGAILEVGDPEEGFTNYGAFPYALGGFSYNLQDLVFLPYFGAPTTTSVNGWLSFQGNPFKLTVCSNDG